MNLTDWKAALRTVVGNSKRQGLETFSSLEVCLAEAIRVHQLLSY